MSVAKEEDGYRPQEGHDSSRNDGNDASNQGLSNQKLFMITCGISISYFLVLLNSTVVVTVRQLRTSPFTRVLTIAFHRPFPV